MNAPQFAARVDELQREEELLVQSAAQMPSVIAQNWLDHNGETQSGEAIRRAPQQPLHERIESSMRRGPLTEVKPM